LKSGKLLIVIAIIASLAAFAGMIAFVGQGNVRQTPIFWTEKVEQTVVFEDIDGKVQLRAIKGVTGEPNPTLLSRTSFVYILTVINNGDRHHRLYIEGFNVQTDLLEPGQQETIKIYPTEEGIYNYFDKRQYLEKLGQIKIITVVPSDEFQGIWRDLI
jgi:hypothetical protein